ncbi:hypothetical protein AB4Z48_23370 [Cupriavidus sp. 2TAF22]|uniref:hypothetical protein n=1 Tax=unclassified Cupriavidus TaxID=2640874 RepID=UPI003F922203
MNKRPLSLRIGLSTSSVALVRRCGWLRRTNELLAEAPLSAEPDVGALSGLRAALADTGCTRMPTSVILGSAWTRMFMVTPPRNTERLRDCQAAIGMRFGQLYADRAEDWAISADCDAKHAFLACAAPRCLVDGLRQAATDHRLALVAIQPRFIAAWNRWRRALPRGAWFGVMDDDALVLGLVDHGRLTDVRTLPVPAIAPLDRTWLAVQLAREALRHGLPAPARLCLCGQVPAAWFDAGVQAPQCVALDGVMAQATAGAELALTGARP